MGLYCIGCHEKVSLIECNQEVINKNNRYAFGSHDPTFRVKQSIPGNYECRGDIVMIDDFIIDTISILNQKGWATRDCCVGHFGDEYSRAYISFTGEAPPLSELPQWFCIEDYKDRGVQVIRDRSWMYEEDISSFEQVAKRAQALYDWAFTAPHKEEIK